VEAKDYSLISAVIRCGAIYHFFPFALISASASSSENQKYSSVYAGLKLDVKGTN